MATTESADRTVAEGKLAEVGDGSIVLALPGTDYRHLLLTDAAPTVPVGKPIAGRIHAKARRVDKIRGGGCYVEPVYGRPRRVQGRVIATDPAANTITVKTRAPFICELTANQLARDFAINELVTFDVEKGARFEEVAV